VTLPVLVLNAGSDAAARARTIRSLAAQSVDVRVCDSLRELALDSHDYVVFVLAGAELDVTACERAVWFLAARPNVPCVTGGHADATDASHALASALQFVVVTTAVVNRLLPDVHAALHAATGLALLVGAYRDAGHGGGWLAEPVIRTRADSALLASLSADIVGALRQLSLEETALIDMSASRLPLAPQQRLLNVPRPALRARVAPVTGLRILALLQGFPMGGYTAFNTDLLPRLAAKGHAITTCTTEWWRTDWRLDQVRTAAPDMHHAHAVVPPAAVPAYVDWLIESRQIDVVLLSHSQLGYHMLPFLRARHAQVAFVDYVHTDWFESGMYGSYAAMAARWEGELDAQLATSHGLVNQLVANGCAAEALRAAHIGIDTNIWHHEGADRLADVRAALGASASTLVLLFAGRVSPEKRPHLAVDVAAALLNDGHDVQLIVAGGGPLLRTMHERAVTLGIGDRVKLLGELDEPTLRHVYAASDVFLAPSEIEGIARSLYEAMAMGCVPVVSDVGGQRELVVAGTGSLVDASRDDAAPYIDGVRPWLDSAARKAASATARSHMVTQFDVARTVTIVSETLQLARVRRCTRQAVLPAAIADELAVLSIEVTRRHVLQAAGR
jgi:glycosyltransferase involved in cell wall biosynthesis